MKVLDVRVGDTVEIDGGRIVLHVRQKSGQQARLAIEAAPDVAIRRVEATDRGVAAPFRKLNPAT